MCWSAAVEPHCPKSKTGRPLFAIETMLRIHYLQQWFGLSDPVMEEALHDTPVYREIAHLTDTNKAGMTNLQELLLSKRSTQGQNQFASIMLNMTLKSLT